MSTPAKPRASGIPARTGIATPSRSRSSSTATAPTSNDSDFADQAFAAAIKANDPAHHRPSGPSDARHGALSPQSAQFSLSTRRPTSSRPSSAASYRPKTPTRSVSRQGETSIISRSFVVGDDVRIESLGYEGLLRFVGEIEGKMGIWAGVELSGGFYGKGKNDGSVNGKHYFVCPPKCGVFVAMSKLSPATAGLLPRPSSVASSSGGRSTPSISGKLTPSHRSSSMYSSNGRSTPSSGRNTPSYSTHLSAGSSKPGEGDISKSSRSSTTSRASRYPNLSIQNLDSRPSDSESSTMPPAPQASSRTSSISPHRSIPSPFTTPKSSRAAPTTPRPRVPSAVSMPPPPSPVSHHDEESFAQLLSRLQALEYENDRIRSASLVEASEKFTEQLDKARVELDEISAKNMKLEGEIDKVQGALSDVQSSLQAVTDQRDALVAEIQTIRSQHSGELTAIEDLVRERDSEIAGLRVQSQALDDKLSDSSPVLSTGMPEVSSLQGRVSRLEEDLEDERREKAELTRLVDDLREAGQETIALYETKLNMMDRERYELASKLESTESTRHSQTSLSASVDSHSSPEKIDNETLRDQIHHLQMTISTMEDTIHELRAVSERDDTVLQEKIKRLKEKEEHMRNEVQEARLQVQRQSKLEASARTRIEEIEGALQESTIALEMARAEVETLRTQLADTGNQDSQSTSLQREVPDTNRLLREVHQLKTDLEESRRNEQAANVRRHQDDQVEMKILQDLRDVVDLLEADNTRLQTENHGLRSDMKTMEQTLKESRADADLVKKKNNRDFTIDNGLLEPKLPMPSPKTEEIAGLKHIIQQLQEDNRRLSSDNQLLQSDLEKLRKNLGNRGLSPAADSHAIEAELTNLRKKFDDLESSSANTIRNLNKEISELETLVESKIYREDELEQEVERLREKANRQKKSSKSSVSSAESRPRSRHLSTTNEDELVCEICDRRGHDFLTCHILKDDSSHTNPPDKKDLWCTDCDSSGHLAKDCPLAPDVF